MPGEKYVPPAARKFLVLAALGAVVSGDRSTRYDFIVSPIQRARW